MVPRGSFEGASGSPGCPLDGREYTRRGSAERGSVDGCGKGRWTKAGGPGVGENGRAKLCLTLVDETTRGKGGKVRDGSLYSTKQAKRFE